MFIKDHFDNLREKPEHIRRRAAFWYSFGVTAVIFAFWIASFTPAGTAAQGQVAAAVSHAGTPAQSLIAGVGGFFTDIKDLILGPKKIVYTTVEVSAGRR